MSLNVNSLFFRKLSVSKKNVFYIQYVKKLLVKKLNIIYQHFFWFCVTSTYIKIYLYCKFLWRNDERWLLTNIHPDPTKIKYEKPHSNHAEFQTLQPYTCENIIYLLEKLHNIPSNFLENITNFFYFISRYSVFISSIIMSNRATDGLALTTDRIERIKTA